MIDLNKYLLESVFDEPSNAKLNKQMIAKIKAWVKTIKKDGKGRVKFDVDNMKVILPEQASFTIYCPIPESITFELGSHYLQEYTSLNLHDASDNDINKVKLLPLGDKYLYNPSITSIPSEWSSIDNNIYIQNPENNIDLSSLSEIKDIEVISNKKIKISGVENIKSIRSIQFSNIAVDGIFKKLNKTSINMDNVDCDPNLFKQLNSVTDRFGDTKRGLPYVTLNKCLIDLSNITKTVECIKLETIEDLNVKYLPKSINLLSINDKNVSLEDLVGIDLSNISNLKIAGLQSIKPSILKDQDAFKTIIAFNNALSSGTKRFRGAEFAKTDEFPEEILNYFKKNCKLVKKDDCDPNKKYIGISKDFISYLNDGKFIIKYISSADGDREVVTKRETYSDKFIPNTLKSGGYIFELNNGIALDLVDSMLK